MNKKLFVLLMCVISGIFLSACNDGKKFNLPVKELEIKLKDGKISTVKAEIARKEEERNYGYMNRKNIPEGTGMLFVFERDQILNFYMKNTPSPLSIAFIDSTGKIRDIFDMTPYSLKDITSTCSVRYALEVPQGWFASQGISAGDTVIIPSKF